MSAACQGCFLLVNVNTEAQKALVREHGIISLPTVKLYHQGVVVDSIYSVQSDTGLRIVIDRYATESHENEFFAAGRRTRTDPGGPEDRARDLALKASRAYTTNLAVMTTQTPPVNRW